MERVERPNAKFPLFVWCEEIRGRKTERKVCPGMAWFFFHLCYSGLFHGEIFLNISVCVWMTVPALVLSTSFTAVNTASSFRLSTSLCVCAYVHTCILTCSMNWFRRVWPKQCVLMLHIFWVMYPWVLTDVLVHAMFGWEDLAPHVSVHRQ